MYNRQVNTYNTARDIIPFKKLDPKHQKSKDRKMCYFPQFINDKVTILNSAVENIITKGNITVACQTHISRN